MVEALYEATGIGLAVNGRNGEGDPYWTDGEIVMSRLAPGCASQVAAPVKLGNPMMVRLKNWLWRAVARPALGADADK